MDIDTVRDIGQGDNIDIVGRVGHRGLDGWCFNKPREALAVAIDRWINPITYWHSWSNVGISLVNIPNLVLQLWSSSGEVYQHGSSKRGSEMHDCLRDG